MKIYLLRHAEVELSYKNKYNGHNLIGLSPKGETQARDLCKTLDTLNFDAIFCSDLPRAKKSIKHLKYNKNIIYTDKLREKSWGRHEGLSFDEIISQDKIEYKNFLQWIEALDGERYEIYIQRIKRFFFEFLPSLEKDKILIVTHAGVIKTFLSFKNNISLEEAFNIKINYGEFIIANI